MSSPLDTVPGGVISLSSDLRILAANEGMFALAQRPHDELVGELFDVLLSPPSRILFQTHVYPALRADGRVEEVFLTLAAGSGQPIPVLFNATRAAGADGPRYDALLVRIHARARWETDLLASTRELERERTASRRLADELAATAESLAARHAEEQRSRAFRDAFVGVVSHELRTPITTIYGMSHVLRQRHASMDPVALGQHLADIEVESDRLRRLTEDLLVLSRAEGAGLQVSPDPIVLRHVAQASVTSEQARSPGHRFTLEVEPGLPLVLGEELYVEQVLRNYLGNAAKYSPPGTTIDVRVVGETGGIAVRVVDAGPGLGESAPDQLFDLFYRAPDAISQTSGAGIGLFVCRELVQAMGGRVWAGPAPAPAVTGAEFGFWLPAAPETDVDEG